MLKQEMPSIAKPVVMREVKLGETVEEISSSILNGLRDINSLRRQINESVDRDFRRNGNDYEKRKNAGNVRIEEIEDLLGMVEEALTPLFIIHLLKERPFFELDCLVETIRDSFKPYYDNYVGDNCYITRDRRQACAFMSYDITDNILKSLTALGVIERVNYRLPRGDSVLDEVRNCRLTNKGRKIASLVLARNSTHSKRVSALLKSVEKPLEFFSGLRHFDDKKVVQQVMEIVKTPFITIDELSRNRSISWSALIGMHRVWIVDIRHLPLRGRDADSFAVFATNESFRFLKEVSSSHAATVNEIDDAIASSPRHRSVSRA